tara:strand:+ start:322 stop:579 length:258 start_codon:yes stop_codon:yes gene_type:complete
MHKALKLVLIFSITLFVSLISASATGKTPRSKFYDFSDQLIDGERKKPTTLYTNARQKVKFDRLIKLKKSFLPKLFKTAKESVFK